MNIKTKINNWALRKLKSFYTEKETINKTKRQPSEWEKIFTNNETVKGLISKMYKQLMKVNKKKKIGRRSKQTFLQRRHAAAAAKSLQSCPTLCNPINSSPLGSSVPGILQARTVECVAISFSITSVWDERNCAVDWAFFDIAFLRDWNENWPIPALWPLLSFPNLLAYWVQHFHSFIF